MPDAPPQAAALVCEKCALLAAVSAYAILLMQLSVTAVILLAGKSAARELAGALAPNLYLFLLSWLFVFTFSLALNLLSFPLRRGGSCRRC